MCLYGWQVILDVGTYLVQAQRVIFICKFSNIQAELTLPSDMAALFLFFSAYANTILLLLCLLLLLLNCGGAIGPPGFLIKQDCSGIKDHNSCRCSNRRKSDIFCLVAFRSIKWSCQLSIRVKTWSVLCHSLIISTIKSYIWDDDT